MTTWMRCHWDEGDTWFYFEVDSDGWVIRQVELEGPELIPVAAASVAEGQRARDAGRLDEYDGRFGITAESPVSEWEGHDPEQLTFEEFEEVWGSARRRIASRPG
ncbi:hypothetical protein [Streptomyces ficellus]|uniref:Uncharacterized protein n=1 Tax=Streptomyces ficellus TaxID=1977088 RepID=A0A6I6F9L1_9ACTN|nr:hypothetical protein [Streptomyces ficellus]QGV79644.1 hypothetical protein EIZ62_16385 [Streptomyces ficellus]